MSDSVVEGRERLWRLEADLLKLYGRDDISASEKNVLLDAINHLMWDDAIHVAAPWEPRSSLCGNWFRNLVPLEGELPGGWSGCWTCIMAAEWMLANGVGRSPVTQPEAAPEPVSKSLPGVEEGTE